MASGTIPVTVDAKQIMNKVTMHIKIKRATEWRWRATLGIWLIRLAALIMWTTIEVEDA